MIMKACFDFWKGKMNLRNLCEIFRHKTWCIEVLSLVFKMHQNSPTCTIISKTYHELCPIPVKKGRKRMESRERDRNDTGEAERLGKEGEEGRITGGRKERMGTKVGEDPYRF
jgi:hypothetical protein